MSHSLSLHPPCSPHHVPGLLERLVPAFDDAVTTSGGSQRAAIVAAVRMEEAAAAAAASRLVDAVASTPKRAGRGVPPRRPLSAVSLNPAFSASSIASLCAAQPSPVKPASVIRPPPRGGYSAISTKVQGNFGGVLPSPSPPPAHRIPRRQLRFSSNESPARADLLSPTKLPASARAAKTRPPQLHLAHPALQRMRLFRCRADWLAALQALPLFAAEFSAWRGVFGLAVEWLRHQQQVRRAAQEARDIADEADGWEEQPGGQAAPVRSNSSSATARVKNTGRGLEEYCAMLMQLRGCSQTSVKGGPRDGGIDLLAARQLPSLSSAAAAAVLPSSTDMAAVQCKEYYNGDSQSYYHATVTTEEVRAFHSCIVGLEFFNLQQMDFNDRRTRADTASSSSIASLSLLPPTPQLIADTRTLSVAYLITSGTFAQQARDFIAAFNSNQERKWPMGCMQSADGGSAENAGEPQSSPPFKGRLHLIDGAALCTWLEEADAQDPDAMPRLEIQRACDLLTQCRSNLRLFAEQREAWLQLDYSSWPWQQQLQSQPQDPSQSARSSPPSPVPSSPSPAAAPLCDSLDEDLAQQFCQAVVIDQ